MKILLSFLMLFSFTVAAANPGTIENRKTGEKVKIVENGENLDFFLITSNSETHLNSLTPRKISRNYMSSKVPYGATEELLFRLDQVWGAYDLVTSRYTRFCRERDWNIKGFLLCYFPVPSALVVYPLLTSVAVTFSAGYGVALAAVAPIEGSVRLVKRLTSKENVTFKKMQKAVNKEKNVKISNRKFKFLVKRLKELK